MSKLIVCLALLLAAICCLSLTQAAPAEHLLDWKTAIEKIIYAYERKYPGPSKRYPIEVAHVIDPKYYSPNL